MPHMNGIDATKCIKGEFPNTLLIGLSVEEELDVVQRMQSAGIYAYLAKEPAVNTMCEAIQEAVASIE